MTAFFEENRTAKLFLQASCGENCWRVKEDHMKYIGIRTGMLEAYRTGCAGYREIWSSCPASG